MTNMAKHTSYANTWLLKFLQLKILILLAMRAVHALLTVLQTFIMTENGVDLNSNTFDVEQGEQGYENPTFKPGSIKLNAIKRRSSDTSQHLSMVAALKTHNVQMSYGTFSVLKGINMTVPQGSIYGLLGASGCGKTTFLRCVVGRHKPDSGSIKVFGFTPGTKESGIPGPIIGYMPQELALFLDFTIYETFVYFARLFQLKKDFLESESDALMAMLDLPDKHRLVAKLSGGQKRRVSLAVALLHRPPLLILDEPTVGVDPLLRQKIWKHLVDLTRDEGLTVIITTHYIEEAKDANVVGLMRGGRLLSQASPLQLMDAYGEPTLEGVFLRQCMLDSAASSGVDANILQQKSSPPMTPVEEVAPTFNPKKRRSIHMTKPELKFVTRHDPSSWKSIMARIYALVSKDILRVRRNIPMLLIQFMLPTFQLLLFSVCIGNNPHDLKIAIYNPDSPRLMSDFILKRLNNVTMTLVEYETFDDALDSIRWGQSWAALIFSRNYSRALQARSDLCEFDNNAGTIEASKIRLFLDNTNPLISATIQRELYETMFQSAKEAIQLYAENYTSIELPVNLEDPIYGKREPVMIEYMTPGASIVLAFIAAMSLTTLSLVLQRKEGLMERTLVAGASTDEFIIAQILSQLFILVVQVSLMLVVSFGVMGIPSEGPIMLASALLFLQGVAGMAYGLLVSSLCNNEADATILALGSVLPLFLISGVLWPIEAMPNMLYYCSFFMPNTYSAIAMRDVLLRGWTLFSLEVILGFVSAFAWIGILIVTSAIIFRYST